MAKGQATPFTTLSTTMKRFSVLLVTATFALGDPASGQAGKAEIPPAELREDLAVFRGVLEESHAGLYWFITKPELDRRFSDLEADVSGPMDARAFHTRLLSLVSAIRHGHTSLDLPGEGIGYRLRRLRRDGEFLPFEVRVIRDRLFIAHDLSDKRVVGDGAEIVAVDGRTTRSLLDTMRLYLSADGANESFKRFQLGPGYQFNYLLTLLFDGPNPHRVDAIERHGGRPHRYVVRGMDPLHMAERYRARTGQGIDSYPSALAYRPLTASSALLTVGSFYERRLGVEAPGFDAFLATTFRKIRDDGITALIVDLRANEGGNESYVPLLYSYLADKPFRLATPTVLASATMSYLRYAENPSDEINAFAANPRRFVTLTPKHDWVLRPEYDQGRYNTFEPRAMAYTGRLYLLTDGGSFSATNELLDLVYRYHRREGRYVRFIGEQNGGDNSSDRVTGGQMLQIILPHTRQRLRLPLMGFSRFFSTTPPLAVIPDVAVDPSVEDILRGRDPALAAAERLVARQRERSVRCPECKAVRSGRHNPAVRSRP